MEAHTVGEDDWTTLEDVNGHTTQDTGFFCLDYPDVHPFISSHYQTVDVDAETCTPEGDTGEWWAASGPSDGPEDWQVDLSDFAGSDVELSISYVSDPSVALPGVFVDEVEVSTGEGTTSFESGLEGWTVPGPPAGSPGNDNDWIVGGVDDTPPATGDIAAASLERQPEINEFLAGYFGPYPWPSSGGIVFDTPGLGFALETQTRPVYAPDFFTDSISGDGVVVHELAHQWYGDSVRLHRWRDIWLNEAFATYAEWLWSEYDGLGTAQENADFWYGFWRGGRPVLAVAHRQPGSRIPVREPGLLPRRVDGARAAPGRRGRRLLRHPAGLAAEAGRQDRNHGAVHRAGRADQRGTARRAVRDLVVHTRSPARTHPCPGRGSGAAVQGQWARPRQGGHGGMNARPGALVRTMGPTTQEGLIGFDLGR